MQPGGGVPPSKGCADVVPAHLRRGRSLLVLTQDNQYKLSSPPADPHGARSPSREAWKATAGSPQSPKGHYEGAYAQDQSPTISSQSSRQHGTSRPVKRFSFRAGRGILLDARSRQLSRRLSSFGITEGNVFGSLATGTVPEAAPADFVLKDQETDGKVHLHSADLFERVRCSISLAACHFFSASDLLRMALMRRLPRQLPADGPQSAYHSPPLPTSIRLRLWHLLKPVAMFLLVLWFCVARFSLRRCSD